jgi:hypothetical protein
MSFLTDNDTPQQNSSRSPWNPNGPLTDVADVENVQLSRTSFYKNVFLPVWKLLGDAATTLLLEWFSGTLNMVGRLVNWQITRQAQKEQRFTYWNARQQPETVEQLSISLEAPIGLRKLTGENRKAGTLGNSRNSAEQLAERKTTNAVKLLPKTNPWLEAARKQQCVLDIQSPQQKKPSRKAAKLAQKNIEDEPNRGLDDIYTQPVKGFFPEEKDFQLKKSASTWKKSVLSTVSPQPADFYSEPTAEPSTKAMAESIVEPIAKPLAESIRNPIEKQVAESISEPIAQFIAEPIIELLCTPVAELPVSGLKEELDQTLQHRSNAIPAANTTDRDHFSWVETTAQAISQKKELQDYDLIPGLSPSPTKTETPTESKPESPSQSGQRFTGKAKPEDGISTSTPPQPNRHGASVLLAKARASNLEFKRRMPHYQEMKNDVTGADLMAANNRILHNSISNLTETYFKRAAQEEQQKEEQQRNEQPRNGQLS